LSFSLAAFFVVPTRKLETVIMRTYHFYCRCAHPVISLVAIGPFTKTLVFSANNTNQTRAKHKSLRAKHKSLRAKHSSSRVKHLHSLTFTSRGPVHFAAR